MFCRAPTRIDEKGKSLISTQANLRMALPPGWMALEKDALISAIDDGFADLGEGEGLLMDRFRAASTHLVAFSPSPMTGKPQAILAATVIDEPDGAIGLDGDHSGDWMIRAWRDEAAIGHASSISRAARTIALGEQETQGLIALYEVAFGPGRPGAVVTMLMKLPADVTDEAISVLDEIAATVSVGQRD